MNNLLIRFQDQTLVLASEACPTVDSILDQVSLQTHWPRRCLAFSTSTIANSSSSSCSFYSVRVISGIRGGKGGFGTLLKGSARQAGAKQTTDFGACRDLQGRRLKHVNDQVAFQEWKQWNDKVEAGVATKEEMAKALVKSSAAASGVPGWYLQLPSWSEVSVKKQQSQMWKQYHSWKRHSDAEKAVKEQAKQAIDRQIHEYVDRAEQLTMKASQNTINALQEGLRASKRQRTQYTAPPEAMITLAGNAVLAVENDRWCMQSPSNFCTVAVVLEGHAKTNLYFEARLQTGGLCQIGWATAGFCPDSATGDGVGDDLFSWAFDPSRQIKLHGENSAPYGDKNFKAGDVIGCLYSNETGDVSFSLNGKALGVAFQIKSNRSELKLYPAISCNEGEIVEIRLQPEEVEYCPDIATAVGLLLIADVIAFPTRDALLDVETNDPTAPSQPTAATSGGSGGLKDGSTMSQILVEPLDLDGFETAEQFEVLGLDRLKGALMAIGVKCGGSLQERAARLLSLKGLDPSHYPKNLLAKR